VFVNDSDVLEPPQGGWPDIAPDRLKDLGKTDEVIMLLRHLPYLRSTVDGNDSVEAGPSGCRFHNWLENIRLLGCSGVDFESLIVMSEDSYYMEEIPPHVVGLVTSRHEAFLLDTELGVVYWIDCLSEIKANPSREPIQDDSYDYAPEEEAEWRAQPAWAIADFFELLKDQFRQQCFVPISSCKVYDTYAGTLTEGLLPVVQAIYREHGWPDLERYRKQKCLEAVRVMMEERFPDEY
jgi:hypothetical protein